MGAGTASEGVPRLSEGFDFGVFWAKFEGWAKLYFHGLTT